MPLYEYECETCAQRFERIQKFSDPLVATCPSCDGPVRKLLSSPAIQFKGTGWYITDYAKKSSNDPAKGASGGDSNAKSESSSETKSETKTEAKSETKKETKSTPAKSE